ncbi:hypothetical protein BDZ89DRAFT_240648 [Hymenopellis radicata]|nr:hypothetical protein BDZ89DRAFT_240648 [Hymenopellis radicata]
MLPLFLSPCIFPCPFCASVKLTSARTSRYERDFRAPQFCDWLRAQVSVANIIRAPLWLWSTSQTSSTCSGRRCARSCIPLPLKTVSYANYNLLAFS